MSVNLEAQAAQSAAQGQQMLQDYRNKADTARSDYNTYKGQADTANQKVNDYTNYMKGEGSAGNQFHGEMSKELGDLGYSEDQMTGARNNLNQATGAMSAYNDFANTAASKWGMNAGGFAAANANALGGINNNIAANQGVVNGLHDIYKTAQTGANAFTGQVVQGQHETLAGLQNVYTNAANQRDNAGSMMQMYEGLAQRQGGLNAEMQQSYAAARQAYAAASQAMAQSALLISQTKAQDQQNQITDRGMKAYQDYLDGKVDANGKPIVKTYVPPNMNYQKSSNTYVGNF